MARNWNPPPRRQRRFSDVDFPEPESGRRRRTEFATPAPHLQRDLFKIARAYPVAKLNGATALERSSADVRGPRRTQGALDARSRKLAGDAQPLGKGRGASHVPVIPSSAKKRRFSAQAVSADRRFFSFDGFPKTTSGMFAKVVPAFSDRLRFEYPSSVVPCIQRTTRREVLFARRAAGKGSSRKPKRRTFTSNIGC